MSGGSTNAVRLLAILDVLQNGHVVSSDRVKRAAGYDGSDSDDRKFRRDKRILVDRGLIETGITTQGAPNRTGLRRREIRSKPQHLGLTRAEHAAIWHARDVLGVYPGTVLPYDDGARSSVLDQLVVITRFVEERGDGCTLAEVSEGVGLPLHIVRGLIAAHLEIEVGVRQHLMFVPEFEDDDDEDWEIVKLDWSAYGHREDRLREVGMANLGFFPYSRAEVAERLALIDRALVCNELDESTKRLLATSGSKLREWQMELDRDPMS